MTYALGGLAGLILGLAVGYLKNLLLWKKYLRDEKSAGQEAGRVGDLYMRALVSYGVNVLTLVAAFLIRDLLPFSEIAFLIGTAAGLVVMNKVLVFGQKKQGDGRREEL